MAPSPRLDRLLDEPLARDPGKLALACEQRRLSFADLADLERRLAAAMLTYRTLQTSDTFQQALLHAGRICARSGAQP